MPESIATLSTADIELELQRAGTPEYKFVARSMMTDAARAANMFTLFLRTLQLPGDVAECGVYDGTTSYELIRYIETAGIDKTVHLFDTFEGFPDVMTNKEREIQSANQHGWWGISPGSLACPAEIVAGTLKEFSRFKIHKGTFSQTFQKFDTPLCFIYADADLFWSTVEIIRLADRLLVPGGIILFDDFLDDRFAGVERAVCETLNIEAYDLMISSEFPQAYAVKRGGCVQGKTFTRIIWKDEGQ